ncbi:MAG: hypothetical protein HY306_12615 [Nitrosomonadales bacterium]|nr:hypothetical protein [Nitrosomonadales bacterium]
MSPTLSPEEKLTRSEIKFNLIGAAIAAFLAVVQFRLIAMFLQNGFISSAEAAYGITIGKPYWRVYQNRVLGPYAIDVISPLFPSYVVAHIFFSIVALMIAGFLAWKIGKRIGGKMEHALMAIFLFHLGFTFLLAPPWLYAWDYLDAIFFLLFVDFVIAGKRWFWFAGLFSIAIFNRESALFIALWMLLDPLIKWKINKQSGSAISLDKGMAIAGIFCLASGAVIVEFLRQHLLIEEVAPKMLPNATFAGPYIHFRLFDNLNAIGHAFSRFEPAVPLVLAIFLLGIVCMAAFLAYKHPYKLLGLMTTYALLIASLVFFGYFPEARIYIVLIPLLIVGTLMLATSGEHTVPSEKHEP